LAKAGLRYIGVHDLRHTFASLLIQNGESLAYVKEQMGHHSITIDTPTVTSCQVETKQPPIGSMTWKQQPSAIQAQPMTKTLFLGTL
jgi:hypothetical protein